MTVAASILAAITALNSNAELMDAIVNGPATGPTSIVETSGGPVKTLARISAESSAFDAALVDQEFGPASNAMGVLVRPLGLLTTLGEVQSNPSSNTMLGRLKTIATSLAGPLTVGGASLTSATAAVANTASLSSAVDCRAAKPVGILFPAALNNLANLTGIQVSFDGATYVPLLNADGTVFTAIPLTASAAIPLSLLNMQFVNYIKLQFGTNANASTSFTVVLAP